MHYSSALSKIATIGNRQSGSGAQAEWSIRRPGRVHLGDVDPGMLLHQAMRAQAGKVGLPVEHGNAAQ